MSTSKEITSADFQTLSEMFLKAIDRHCKPDVFLAKSAGRYQPVSSQEALRQVAALASALVRFGIGRGDRVAILSENRLEWALTDYAVLGLGAIVVPIYPTLLEPDLEYILHDSGSKGVVLSTAAQLKKLANVRANVPNLRFVLMMDQPQAGERAQSWHEVVKRGAEGGDRVAFFRERALSVKPDETATILYTSGTTGQPKGVILTHSNIVSNIRSCLHMYPLRKHEVSMSFLPLSHIFERMFDYSVFWLGTTVAYAESMEALPQNLLEVRPMGMAVVPRVLERVHERVMHNVHQLPPRRQRLFQWAIDVGKQYFPYTLQGRPVPLLLRLKRAFANAFVYAKIRDRLGGRVKVMFSGSAPLSRELTEFFYAVGLPVYEGYGLTETSPVISTNYPGCVKLGTVGRSIPGVQVKLGEEVTEEQGEGSGREILVRGPNVTPGYYHAEDNREAFEDGWFRTGDLGALDDDGFLRITGRKKHLLKTSGGKYVSPERLENLFQGHLYVAQILVVGEARKFVSALIVPNFVRLEAYARSHGIAFKDREDLVSRPEVQSFLQEQVDELTRWLPPHERIRQLGVLSREFTIESGELSATQKIKRHVVEERYQHLIEEIYQRPAPASLRLEARDCDRLGLAKERA